MTAGTAAGGPAPVADPAVADLIAVATERFVNLGFLAPDGLLDLRLDGGPLRGVRVELPRGQLRLQAIGVSADGVADVAPDASVRASSWDETGEAALDPVALLDVDAPTGTLVHTRADQPAWVEVSLRRPLPVTRIRVRNVTDDAARTARAIRVSARSRWRTKIIYDGRAALRAWGDIVTAAQAAAPSTPSTTALIHALDLTVRGDYGRAHTYLASKVADEGARRWFRGALNESLLPARHIEWTVHGPKRPFRNWSDAERQAYVADGAQVVDALRSLTPDVCFGFGSVLAVVRDHALIPHDDDIDIIIGFEPAAASTLAEGLRLVEEHLRPLGFDVSGGFAAHRHVRRPGRKHVDVFVGLDEGETISWYPGARGNLTREIVFPPIAAELLGVSCLIPAQPEVYLERLYGTGWRVPDPFFSHDWDRAAYADIAGTAAPTPPPDAEASSA